MFNEVQFLSKFFDDIFGRVLLNSKLILSFKPVDIIFQHIIKNIVKINNTFKQ